MRASLDTGDRLPSSTSAESQRLRTAGERQAGECREPADDSTLERRIGPDGLMARAQAAVEDRDLLSTQLRSGFVRLQLALAANADARDRLRQAIVGLVRKVRELDDPPERALILVKTLIHESLPITVTMRERDALEAAAVRWAIDAFYEAAS